MDNWQQDLIEIFSKTQAEFDRFVDNVIITTDTMVEDVTKEIDNLVLEVENNLNQDFFQEIDDFLLNLFSILLDDDQLRNDTFVNFDSSQNSEVNFYTPQIKRTANQYSACIGCSNYHGRVYDGNILVCAMHPYGWSEINNCPDWQK